MSFSAKIFNAEIETNLIQQALPSQENGNVTLMALSPFGTVKEIKCIVSLNNKLTHSTQQQHLRPKYQKTKQPSWIQWCSKERETWKNPS